MSASPLCYLCIHGHFYQPPRENPWLEAVEAQESAAPFHDWNERITRECYAPNCRSRLLDPHGKIVGLLNNYAYISFNFGPTLLAWLEKHAPEVLQGIVEGDQISRQRHGGHGNALAQVYNHVILPLASKADQRTQVRWGLADFRRHFGRNPEGMWLAETAVDLASLEVLAEEGLTFTILSPRQAHRWRPVGGEDWTALPDGIDPSRAYLCNLPSGRTITLFFYDAGVARQVAFERLLDNGEKFVARLKGGFDPQRNHAQLMHIATDGESYGHHHSHGDMGLAYALTVLQRDPTVRLTNYGAFLEHHPPEWEVEIHNNSSWSCFHGIERWRSACGCAMRGDWQQDWRGPLRVGLDTLKERLDGLFEQEGTAYFRDPWQARNDYIQVVLDRRAETVADFLETQGHGGGHERVQTTRALWLLEMQRHGMLMFTSCGWFFDEISGLETTQCLRYAARALQLARHFGHDYEPELLAHLARAPSNVPLFGNGRAVWEQLIRPSRVDLERVVAHHCMNLLFRPADSRARVYCYELEVHDLDVRQRSGLRLAAGRMKVRSAMTLDEADTSFVAIHYGGLDFHAVLRPADSLEMFTRFKSRLFDTYEGGSVADLTTLVAREFSGESHRIEDLFADERRQIIDVVLADRLADYRNTFARLADTDSEVLTRLGRMRTPTPAPMRAAASVVLDQRLLEQIRQLDRNATLEQIQSEVTRAAPWGYQPGRDRLGKELTDLLNGLLREFRPHADLADVSARVLRLLEAARLLGINLDKWTAQNRLLENFHQLYAGGALDPALLHAFYRLADHLDISRLLLVPRS